MEFFNKAEAVRLRSHLDKYLVANDDEETVRQSRNGSSRKARWTVELVEGNSHLIRLKSCHGKYLSASDVPLLLGMTGNKVIQTESISTKLDSAIEWEPIRDGFQVKLRTRNGKFLRANGWRNTITHDLPHRTGKQDWVLWDVEAVDAWEIDLAADFEKQLSRFSSMSEDLVDSPTSTWSIESKSPRLSSGQLGMESFENAKTIRLRSHHDKYLIAEEDQESVCQERKGSSKTARWSVEFIHGGSIIRLKSCFGKYLTASNAPFIPGMSQRKVLQTLPRRLDSSVEWEPIREGNNSHIKLKTRYGNFLRANGGLPPWRNSVTHDIPLRNSTQDWILWEVDVLEVQVPSSPNESESIPPSPSDPPSPSPSDHSLPSEPTTPSILTTKPSRLSKLQSRDSFINSSNRVDGRVIYYSIADENGDVEDAIEETSFIFKGNGVHELTRKLEEETGLEDIIVCTRSPLNGKLYPLRLQLPPNNSSMHLVVIQASSKVARDFAKPGLL